MTFSSVITAFRNLNYQYTGVVDYLNRIYNSKRVCNADLAEVAERVAQEINCSFAHNMREKTEDGYVWFGSMEFIIDRTRIHILFPWAQDWEHPESRLDRSIEVYARRSIPKERIKQLTEIIADNMMSKCLPNHSL